MHSWLRNRPLLAYLFAVVVSGLALGVVLGLERVVGYIPLLFLAFVALLEAYAGLGPAFLSVASSLALGLTTPQSAASPASCTQGATATPPPVV